MPLLLWKVRIVLDSSAPPGRAGPRRGPAMDAAPGRRRVRTGPSSLGGGASTVTPSGHFPLARSTASVIGRATRDVADGEVSWAVCYSTSLTGASHRGQLHQLSTPRSLNGRSSVRIGRLYPGSTEAARPPRDGTMSRGHAHERRASGGREGRVPRHGMTAPGLAVAGSGESS